MKNKKGFTLIEILASITIVILLFMIMTPVTMRFIEQSNQKQCEELKNVLIANAELCVLDEVICTTEALDENGEKRYSLNDLYINGYIDEKYNNPMLPEKEMSTKNYVKFEVLIKQTEQDETIYFVYDILYKDSTRNICQ